MGTRLKVMDEGHWFMGVVTKHTGAQCFVQKDGDKDSFACPGDFQDIQASITQRRRPPDVGTRTHLKRTRAL